MKFRSQELIDDLVDRTKTVLNQLEELKQKSKGKLNQKPQPESWSALECLEHLNRYGDYYIPEMNRQMAASKHGKHVIFKSGGLGNYFAKSMLPKEKLNKMKTFKSMNPSGSHLDLTNLEKCIQQQHQLLDVLTKARNVNLTKIKTGVTISKLIRLRLGDTLRVVIYHNQRHLEQALRAARW